MIFGGMIDQEDGEDNENTMVDNGQMVQLTD